MSDIFHGTVVQCHLTKRWGFVESNGVSYFFPNSKEEYRDRRATGEKDMARHFHLGDIVNFRLRPSATHPPRLEAYHLCWLGNPLREELVQASLQQPYLQGILTRINGEEWVVKHGTTSQTLPIEISPWEASLEAVYDARTGSIVHFSLAQIEKLYKLTAVLSDRIFRSDLATATALKESGEPMEALITGRNALGLFAVVMGRSWKGFVRLSAEPSPEEQRLFGEVKRKDKVKVRIRSTHSPDNLGLLLYVEGGQAFAGNEPYEQPASYPEGG